MIGGPIEPGAGLRARRTARPRRPSFGGIVVSGCVALFMGAALFLGAGALQGQTYPGAGDGLMYVGTYDGTIHVLSERTGERVDRIALQTGIPRSAITNHDQTRFYVLNIDYERMEVVDIASKETLDVFTLSEGNEMVRIWSYAVNPQETRAVFALRRYTRLLDRWDVGETELVVYDLESHAVSRELPWPDDEPRLGADMRFSPDGRNLYFFMDEVIVYETEGFTEVERWDYERVLDQGMGQFQFGFPESPYEEEGYFTGLFRAEEPVNQRELLGIARVDLAGRDVDFSIVGPSEGLRFTLGPGGRAYGLHVEIGNYQLWTFDLDARRVVQRIPIRGRTRMRLEASSNGEYLYVWQAGNTIELMDPETGRYVYTIELDADTTTNLIVFPAGSVSAASGAGE